MNITMREGGLAALRRVQRLRGLGQKTGFQTHTEQFKILMSLNDEDCLAVAEKIAILTTQPIARRPHGGAR